MKFSTILSTALLASAASAAAVGPLTSKRHARNEARRAERAAKRDAMSRKTNPPIQANSMNPADTITLGNSSHVDYSSNWAGAVLIGTGYDKVVGTFTVPTPSAPSGGSSNTEYCASAWVGIDGDTCSTAILQTGVDFCVEGSEVAFDAWYEWYPAYASDFDLAISAGDEIRVTVDGTSTTAGTALVENLTTGLHATETFSGETNSLCEYNAEWIVEDFESNGELVPFADFGTVTFSSATATSGSTTVGPEDATILDIEQDNTVLTSVSVTSSSVTVTYV